MTPDKLTTCLVRSILCSLSVKMSLKDFTTVSRLLFLPLSKRKAPEKKKKYYNTKVNMRGNICVRRFEHNDLGEPRAYKFPELKARFWVGFLQLITLSHEKDKHKIR